MKTMTMMIEALEPRLMASSVPAIAPLHYTPSQPPAYDGHSYVLDGVLNIYAPDPKDFGPTWSPPLVDPQALLFGADGIPSVTSIHQGSLSDCYALAAFGSLAWSHPEALQDIIWWDGDGFAVKWIDLSHGGRLVIHTQPTFSTAWQQSTAGEVYWEVLEKTYAWLRTWNGSSTENSMQSLNWGFSLTPMLQEATVTPKQVFSWMGYDYVKREVDSSLAHGDLVTLATYQTAPSMVQSHVYIVLSVEGDNYTLWNPWGFYDVRTLGDLINNGDFVIGVWR